MNETTPLSNATGRLSRTVIALGVVSLFTDIASEMVYTQVPVFLTVVLAAPATAVGLIEGVAESAASLLRLVSGWLSDRSGRRKPLTVLGYTFGAIAKPLLALATVWPVVLLLRFLDRVGKGLRTAPRDALIADSTPPQMRGRAFGLHRAMDTTGAVIGPLLGIWFLRHVSPDLRHLFLFAGLPGILAVVTLILFVREKAPARSPDAGESNLTPGSAPGEEPEARSATPDTRHPTPAPERDESAPQAAPLQDRQGRPSTQKLLHAWRELNPTYRQFLWIVLLFNLGNSSDVFLILRAKSLGFTAEELLWLYAAFNLVEALLGYGAGRLSDIVGRRPLIIAGYMVFALVYAGFALVQSRTAVWPLFLLYGGYYTLTQGVQRAFAADLSSTEQRATQIGAYHTVVGLALLPASLLAGFLFERHPAAPFVVGALTATLSAFLLLTLPRASVPTS
jgi:MFS family permease